MKILTIEDDLSISELYQIIFELHGHEVISAHTCGEARILASETFDVILSDNCLPDGLGSKLVSELKAKFPKILIIQATGDSDLQSEADAILIKPFNIQKVYQIFNERMKSAA